MIPNIVELKEKISLLRNIYNIDNIDNSYDIILNKKIKKLKKKNRLLKQNFSKIIIPKQKIIIQEKKIHKPFINTKHNKIIDSILDDYDINNITDNIEDDENYDEIENLINDVLKTNLPVPKNVKVDDGDLPLAKNFLEFTTQDKFLGVNPYAWQLKSGLDLFNEINPLESDMEWWENLPVDASIDEIKERMCILEYGKCPRTGVTRSELMRSTHLNPTVELIGILGQRSGKSADCGFILAYLSHYLIKLQNPAKAFGLISGSSKLHATLVSMTFKQAKSNLYDPLYGFINNSKWFEEWHKILDHYSNKYSEELYKVKDTFIEYKPRDLIIYPAYPDKRILRGYTRVFFSIDEISWFLSADNNKSVKFNVEEVYTALKNSMANTIRGWKKLIKEGYHTVLPPAIVNISSPSSKADFGMKLLKKASKNRTMIGIHKATWEANPNLTQEDLEEEHLVGNEQNYEKFWRDFGASPALSSYPFIEDVHDFKNSVNKRLVNAANIKTITFKKSSNKEKFYTTGEIKFNWKDSTIPKVLALDAGESNNHFAFSVGHNVLVNNEFIPVIDLVGEIIPQPNAPINFTDVFENIISPIIEELSIIMLVSDRWQSTKILTDAEDIFDIEVEKYSIKYNDCVNFRNDVYDANLRLPCPELLPEDIESSGEEDYPNGFKNKPISHLIFQGLTAQDLEGKGIIKGENYTDDLLRATILAHSYLIHPEYREKFEGIIVNNTRMRGLGAVSVKTDAIINSMNNINSGRIISRRLDNTRNISNHRINIKQTGKVQVGSNWGSQGIFSRR